MLDFHSYVLVFPKNGKVKKEKNRNDNENQLIAPTQKRL